MSYESLNLYLLKEQVSKGFIMLYGETILDTLTNTCIQLIGYAGSGKSTLAELVTETNPRFKQLSMDRVMFNKNEKKAHDYTEEYDQESDNTYYQEKKEAYIIDYAIQLTSKETLPWGESLHTETIAYIEKELGIKPVILKRTEKKEEKTAKRLNELLKKHSITK